MSSAKLDVFYAKKASSTVANDWWKASCRAKKKKEMFGKNQSEYRHDG
jgi:hypothetical protein